MKKKIVVKIIGHKVICRHNGIPEAELVHILGKQVTYLQKSSCRRKLFRRTQVKNSFMDLGKRMGYVFEAIRTAFSPNFPEINPGQTLYLTESSRDCL